MIRVVVADDHAVLREGVAALVRAQPDMRCEGQAASADEVIALCQSAQADVAVIDLGMPGGGVEAIERITSSCPGVRAVAFTMHDDQAYVRAVLTAGGAGYVVKGAAGSELIYAIRSVALGQSYVCIQPGDVQRPAPSRRDSSPPGGVLSVRERQVLDAVVRGFSNREVAERLQLSPKTVDTYRTRLQNKLGVTSRAELVAYALRAGLLSGEGGEGSRP